MATRGFEGINLRNSEENHGWIISVKFHQNWMRSFIENFKNKS